MGIHLSFPVMGSLWVQSFDARFNSPIAAGVTVLPVQKDQRHIAIRTISAVEISADEAQNRLLAAVGNATIHIAGLCNQLADEAKRLKGALNKEGREAAGRGDARTIEAIGGEIEEVRCTNLGEKEAEVVRVAEVVRDMLDEHGDMIDFDAAPIIAALADLDASYRSLDERKSALAGLVADAAKLKAEATSPATLAKLREAGQEMKLRNVITVSFVDEVRILQAQAQTTADRLADVLALLREVA